MSRIGVEDFSCSGGPYSLYNRTMHYLEHLRALREKAHFQTEQAKAVLRQQTEITESLDRLIAELEGRIFDASDEGEESSIKEKTADEKPGPARPPIDEVIWRNENVAVPPLTKKSLPRPMPAVSPTVWEVESVASTPVAAAPAKAVEESSVAAPAGAEPPRKFEFAKLSSLPAPNPAAENAGSSAPSQASSDDTMAISPPAPGSLAAAAGLRPVAVTVNPPSAAEETPIPPRPTPKTPPAPRSVLTNVFFDANSAYLKESELAKLKSVSDSVKTGQRRILRIQGLEDLASSNDFRQLLASRRVMAVKKRLSEAGLAVGQLEFRDIRVSEDGRILEPATVQANPA